MHVLSDVDIDDGFQPPLDSLDTEIVPVVASGSASYSSDLFIAAMVDHLCSVYFPNSAKKDKLFHSMFLPFCNDICSAVA